MPFDAMKGLSEALRDREEHHSRTERHEISEEAQRHNSEIFLKLRRGARVRLDCHAAFHDITKEGTVTAVEPAFRYLKLGDEKIFFEDIYYIEVLEL